MIKSSKCLKEHKFKLVLISLIWIFEFLSYESSIFKKFSAARPVGGGGKFQEKLLAPDKGERIKRKILHCWEWYQINVEGIQVQARISFICMNTWISELIKLWKNVLFSKKFLLEIILLREPINQYWPIGIFLVVSYYYT